MAKICENVNDCTHPNCDCPNVPVAELKRMYSLSDDDMRVRGDIADMKVEEIPFDTKRFVGKPSFWYRTKKVLRTVVDNPIVNTAKQFLPSPVKAVITGAQNTLQLKDNTMDKPKLMSKTIWGAILIAVTAILRALGVDFVSDPATMQTIYDVMFSLAGAFGLYGLRDAVGKLIKGSS